MEPAGADDVRETKILFVTELRLEPVLITDQYSRVGDNKLYRSICERSEIAR
jgi:hypothetical protein